MGSSRDRIIDFVKYLLSKNIVVNIGKNKARGNRGIFLGKEKEYRIDISENVAEDKIISVLLHEYAHYIHFSHDKKMKSLEFIFDELSDEIKEELINVTITDIPKDFASSIFETKEQISSDIKKLAVKVRENYPNYKLSQNDKIIEKNFSQIQKYLLHYDNIIYLKKRYSINNPEDLKNLTNSQIAYIKLKSKQRALRNINAKINKLNKYYNNPSELFARFVSLYYTDREKALKVAPLACEKLSCSNEKLIKELNNYFDIQK